MRNKPKIGIRPVIDGRWGGVRESLEDQTMNMAKAAQKLISENLKYADGTPVECVIAETTIGSAGESGKVADQFTTENVVATLTVTPCWCYGSETMDIDPSTIKAVWGFNGTERPGAVYLAAAMAAHAQRGLPAFSIYGRHVQDADDTSVPEDVKEKILRFARAAIAVGTMKSRSYVNIGGTCMGIAGSTADPDFFLHYLGMRTEYVDMTEILRRIELDIYDPEEFDKAFAWAKENCEIGLDINAAKESVQDIITKSRVIPDDEQWTFMIKHALICKDIIQGNPKLSELGWHEESLGRNGIIGGFQGQRQWTDWMPNADFTEAMSATTFDWNGPRALTPIATENDTLNGVTMLFEYLLTHKAPIFADVRTCWSPEAVERVTGKKPEGVAKDGFIHMINSGAAALDATALAKDADGNPTMKEWYNITDSDIKDILNGVDWRAANNEYFRGGGFSSHFRTEAEIPLTVARINIVEGIGPVLQIAEGWSAVLDDDVHKIIDDRTDRTWPTTWFVPRLDENNHVFKDVYSVMANWGANHGVLTHGHIGADLITLASMLRIPVNMHNVPADKIYRPHSWSFFGTKELESADYRACDSYGPMYR